MYASLREVDKNEEGLEVIKGYVNLGFEICGSVSTVNFLKKKNGVDCKMLAQYEVENYIKKNGKISMMINTPTRGNVKMSAGFRIRRKCIEQRIPLFTCIETAKTFKTAIRIKTSGEEVKYRTVKEYLNIG